MKYSVLDHVIRHRTLKNAEEKLRKRHGVNPGLGVAVDWGPTPRSGAKWTGNENTDLLKLFHVKFDKIKLDPTRKPQKLGAMELAELAWFLGRSANATNEQLYKLLGQEEYFKHVEIAPI